MVYPHLPYPAKATAMTIVSLVPRNQAVALDNKAIADKLRQAADKAECSKTVITSCILLMTAEDEPVDVKVWGKRMTVAEASGIMTFAQYRLAAGFIP